MADDRKERNAMIRLLISRACTRSGDHAWDLALPLMLSEIFPGTLRPVALFYFFSRALMAFTMPRVGRILDGTDRLAAIRVALSMQVVCVCSVMALIRLFLSSDPSVRELSSLYGVSLFVGLILVAFVGSTSFAVMNISMAGDWVPKIFSGTRLLSVNGWMSRVDLSMEILSPLIAGALIASGSHTEFLHSGYLWIMLWNIFSFVPEFLILRSLYKEFPALHFRGDGNNQGEHNYYHTGIMRSISLLRTQPVAAVIMTYSLLWINVLSPHGVLLTAFLKSEWHVNETHIGLFRGMGALIGIFATFLFARTVKRHGLSKSATWFVSIQAVSLIAACIGFYGGKEAFLAVVLFTLISRIGLYGFALGDLQLRQLNIPESVRGTINGFATSMNNGAGLLIFLAGAVLATPASFVYLAWMSAFSVSSGALVMWSWLIRRPAGLRDGS